MYMPSTSSFLLVLVTAVFEVLGFCHENTDWKHEQRPDRGGLDYLPRELLSVVFVQPLLTSVTPMNCWSSGAHDKVCMHQLGFKSLQKHCDHFFSCSHLGHSYSLRSSCSSELEAVKLAASKQHWKLALCPQNPCLSPECL